jgi:hypothetical protein
MSGVSYPAAAVVPTISMESFVFATPPFCSVTTILAGYASVAIPTLQNSVDLSQTRAQFTPQCLHLNS